jgi:hypothetical protein
MTDCVRKAWLDLDGQIMPLEDEASGWVCTELSLGWPEVRDVVNNRPDHHGTDDLSQYWAARQVSAEVVCYGSYVDDLAAQFGPFMVPAARPVLHYVLDRPGAPERTLTLRPAGYAWPISGKQRRNVQLQWVAPDPVARDATEQHSWAWAGSATAPGRLYDLTHNRIYPVGSGAKVDGQPVVSGDMPVSPLLRIYGPATGAQVQVDNFLADGTGAGTYSISFVQSFVIGAGQYVDVNCEQRTAVQNDGTNVVSQITWMSSAWPSFINAPGTNLMQMFAGSASAITQVEAIWRDGYLS